MLHTASRRSSANFCFSPGSSKRERSMTLISVQSSFSLVLLGLSHLGRGAGAMEGMMSQLCFISLR